MNELQDLYAALKIAEKARFTVCRDVGVETRAWTFMNHVTAHLQNRIKRLESEIIDDPAERAE